MLIPKDATVIIPSYAIHRSEQMKYTNPDTFDPSRYVNHPRLASDYAGSPDFNNRDHYGYGAGRRICPGMHLAERTQWRAIAKILWAFDIELAVDPATGQKIVPDPEAFKEGIAHGPKPFKVVFKPRSQAHIDTIFREAEQSLDEVAKWD
jgi:cytochrome P450